MRSGTRWARAASITALAFAALLGACAPTIIDSGPPGPYRGPLPSDGPILYSCADGSQLTVEFDDNEARVAVVGGRSFILPKVGADYYSNGRYAFRGGGATGSWEIARRAPIPCDGA